jgi:hypothetical protein
MRWLRIIAEMAAGSLVSFIVYVFIFNIKHPIVFTEPNPYIRIPEIIMGIFCLVVFFIDITKEIGKWAERKD